MFKIGCLMMLFMLMIIGVIVSMYLLEFLVLGVMMWFIGGFIKNYTKNSDNHKDMVSKKEIVTDQDDQIQSNFVEKRKTYARIASLLMEDKYGTEWMFVELSKDDERLLDELRKEICK